MAGRWGGARLPYVLRQTGDLQEGERVFRLIGAYYVHALNAGICVAEAEGVLEAIVVR